MTVFETAAYGALWGMVTLMAVLAILTVITHMLPGARRDRRDDARVLIAYRDAWDLSRVEISRTARLGLGRARAALIRLEHDSLIESYSCGFIQRYALTTLGREAVVDLEQDKIAESNSDRHGA